MNYRINVLKPLCGILMETMLCNFYSTYQKSQCCKSLLTTLQKLEPDSSREAYSSTVQGLKCVTLGLSPEQNSFWTSVFLQTLLHLSVPPVSLTFLNTHTHTHHTPHHCHQTSHRPFPTDIEVFGSCLIVFLSTLPLPSSCFTSIILNSFYFYFSNSHIHPFLYPKLKKSPSQKSQKSPTVAYHLGIVANCPSAHVKSSIKFTPVASTFFPQSISPLSSQLSSSNPNLVM